jgi:hypothetical protein
MAKKSATKSTTTSKATPKRNGKPVSEGVVKDQLVTQEVNTVEETRSVEYPDKEVKLFMGDKGLTEKLVEDLLLWRTESKVIEEGKKINAEKDYSFGENYLLEDALGNKIRCYANLVNRPFRDREAWKQAYKHLKGEWVLNMQTIIVSKYGNLNDGQHRLVGYKLACQMLRKDKKWQQRWPNGLPLMETAIAFGAEETEQVLRTLDDGNSRDLTDVVYTSPIFSDLMDLSAKKECSRMLAKAVELLWERTRSKQKYGDDKYASHSAYVEFERLHTKLEECVKYIYKLNGPLLDDGKDNPHARSLSKMKLSPGMCAGLLYLMASDSSDYEKYHNSEVPSEKVLKWDHYEKAKKFWDLLSRCGPNAADDPTMKNVRFALATQGGENFRGTKLEKLQVLIKAWIAYRDEGSVTVSDVNIEDDYNYTDEGDKEDLARFAKLDGIDIGVTWEEKKGRKKGDGKTADSGRGLPTKEEIESQARAAREAKGHQEVSELELALKNKKEDNTPGFRSEDDSEELEEEELEDEEDTEEDE